LALLAALVSAVRNDFSQLHYPAVDFVSSPTLHLIVSCPAAFVPSLKILDKFSQWKLVILSLFQIAEHIMSVDKSNPSKSEFNIFQF
jgi:hypothetical protein